MNYDEESDEEYEYSELEEACSIGNIELIKTLLEDGYDPNINEGVYTGSLSNLISYVFSYGDYSSKPIKILKLLLMYGLNFYKSEYKLEYILHDYLQNLEEIDDDEYDEVVYGASGLFDRYLVSTFSEHGVEKFRTAITKMLLVFSINRK